MMGVKKQSWNMLRMSGESWNRTTDVERRCKGLGTPRESWNRSTDARRELETDFTFGGDAKALDKETANALASFSLSGDVKNACTRMPQRNQQLLPAKPLPLHWHGFQHVPPPLPSICHAWSIRCTPQRCEVHRSFPP